MAGGLVDSGMVAAQILDHLGTSLWYHTRGGLIDLVLAVWRAGSPRRSPYHLKRHTTFAGISHVGIQAITSAKMLVREPESRQKLDALIQGSGWAPADKQRVQGKLRHMAQPAYRLLVVIAIIGERRNPAVASCPCYRGWRWLPLSVTFGTSASTLNSC